MPVGMRLKSEGFASSLYDPNSTFTLAAYCKEKGLPYADVGLPVPLETFVAYGLEFQKRFVPELEEKDVVSLRRDDGAYKIRLEHGEDVVARKVVVAVGLRYYDYVPPVLSSLPESHATHCSKHKTLNHFSSREVIVVGAGASALDTAALLHQAGARVRVIARAPAIRLWDPPKPPPTTFIGWLSNPMSGLGRGWKLFMCAEAPLIFRLMPQQFRLDKVKRVLGPSPAWFIKQDIEGKVPLHPGLSIKDARIENNKVKLEVLDGARVSRLFEADHIIAATGYRVDLRRLPFLDSDLLGQIRMVEHTPVLSSNFESSLTGLYFIGTSAANSFGPLLRFAVGARFTARRLAGHLDRCAVRNGGEGWSRPNDHEIKGARKHDAECLANHGN